jgi:phospholipase/carboxylesterase
MLHDKENTITAGKPLDVASRVMILLHGRGSSAADILSLTHYLSIENSHLLAPEATGHSWYPNSFLAPTKSNEPWLSSALELVHGLIDELLTEGKTSDQIYILGFSQGACLALESAATKARRYGGVIAFTGGLIGEVVDSGRYEGDFAGTPVFIGNSDRDPHVPLVRSRESQQVLSRMGAAVTLKVFPSMGHTIIPEEVEYVNKEILR